METYLDKLEQLECLWSENTPCRPMISHAINSFRIPFIQSRNYIVQEYNHKSVNLTESGTYAKGYINDYICIKFESSSIKHDLRNVKKVQIRSIWTYWMTDSN